MEHFEFMETTISKVHQAYLEGSLTAVELIKFYLQRIEAYDKKGPAINSIICVNPNILEEAAAADAYLKEHHALQGPLHGIPVMLKDNFNTSDMPTTAGSIALKGWVPPENAFVVEKLKQAGALILAKTNLHEFAIWGETISSILGQTVNPYDLTRTPGDLPAVQALLLQRILGLSEWGRIRSIPFALLLRPIVWLGSARPSDWYRALGLSPIL